MKRIQSWITLTLLLLMTAMTACSPGTHPGPESVPPAAAPLPPAAAPLPPAAAPLPPAAAPLPLPPAPAQAPPPAVVPTPAPAGSPPATGSGQAPGPVNSRLRAFALVWHTAEAQPLIQELGTRLVMVDLDRTAETYHVSLGENFPERVGFALHFTVSRADGTVRYKEPTTGQAKPATPLVITPDPVTADAEALLGRGDTQAAVDLLTKAAAERPAADTWNLLSYAYLLRGRWQTAADTGEKALALDKYHPYALYNTGMAELELKRYPEAIHHLREAADLQPQRAEPYLALTRAYRESGRHDLAADAAADALKRAPGESTAVRNQLSLGSMVSETLPSDINAAPGVRLADGPYTLFLYPGKGESPAIVYLKGPEGVTGLSVGKLRPDDSAAFGRVDLPGGLVGYFLPGEPIGAHVSASRAWRLFVRGSGGVFRQIIFTGEDDQFVQPVEDFLRSAGMPSVQGDRLIAIYADDASGKSTVKSTWQLVPGEAKATQVESTRENRDPNK